MPSGKHSLDVIVISPGHLAHAQTAITGAKAGGLGVLDLEYSPADTRTRGGQIEQNLTSLLLATRPEQRIGLRLSCTQLAEAQNQVDSLYAGLISELAAREATLVISLPGGTDPSVQDVVSPDWPGNILLQVGDTQGLKHLIRNPGPIQGVILCGQECGGFTGQESAFLLTQKAHQLLQGTGLDFYVQGGIGPHTAAACYTAGATGVVLQDQLLLLPESPLPPAWKRRLENSGGQESELLGTGLGAPCRVLTFPHTLVRTALGTLEKELEIAAGQGDQVGEQWMQEATRHMAWADPEQAAWPVGQGLVQAHAFSARYAGVGRCVRHVMQAAVDQTRSAAQSYPFAPGSALADDQGTAYPLVQGPMARVSDCPEFLAQVAASGALPFAALGTMSGPEAGRLVAAVHEALGEAPWGVGLLGFLPPELYQAQIQEVLRIRPKFALLAGGRPDQARKLEEEGIRTYLHVPVPGLIPSFRKQKLQGLIFEGRESGGHIGPLGSFPLWEAAISALVEEAQDQVSQGPVSVLFAGGIHDDLSAAMVAAAAAPLSRRARVGIQMGSVYLLSEEAVHSGAISAQYQEQALACEQTAVLDIGAGHANRCAKTPFHDTFYARKRSLLQENQSPADMARSLEQICRGRLKIAAKGIARDSQGQECPLAPEQCLEQGMYLVGEACTRQTRTTSLPAINEQVCLAGSEIVAHRASGLDNGPPLLASENTPSSIAITGIAFFLPGARDLETYWQNIVHKTEVITDLPSRYWDQRLIYTPDKNAKDGSYSTRGGFIDEIVFDPLQYGIPPKYVGHISPVQLIPLETTRRALQDAGYFTSGFDRQNTAVIFSNSDYGGFLGHQLLIRSYLPLTVGLEHEPVSERLAEWSEESLPGVLPNIVAGRVANRFNLGGPNYVLDAACASSLTALDQGIRELESGRSNVAIVGCAEFGQSPFAYTGFSRIQALSAQGRAKVFDSAADGMVMAEGCVVLTLKRLEDAELDGDKIYAVIKAVGASSDGKGMGMTAPLPAGQQRALRRAYAKAGFPISSLGLYEAHGTGTPVGDRAELETICGIQEEDRAAPKSCCIGAGKALMGHTKITAGLAAVVKCVLSMAHKVLPPQGNLDSPLPPLKDPDSPLAAYSQAVPWLASAHIPRRCGISSFGFGGSNAHAVLEEYTAGPQPLPPGGERWPRELVLFAARDREQVKQKTSRLLQALEQGAAPRLRDLAYSCARDFELSRQEGYCLALVPSDLAQLTSLLRDFLLHCQHPEQVSLPAEIISRPIHRPDPEQGHKVAFLLPGQGAQYVHMAREDCLYFPELRQALEKTDTLLQGSFTQPLHRYLFPPSAFSREEKKAQDKDLQDGHVLQPLLAALSAGYLQLARRLGITADMVCGHSLGEYSALHAAGALSLEQLITLTAQRGRLMAQACRDLGSMAAVKATRERVEAVLEEFQEVTLANHNAPRQVVISGQESSLQDIVSRLKNEGVSCSVLPVAGAFHSAMMRKVQHPLARSIAACDFQAPQIPVFSNITAQPYPGQPQAIQRQLQDHLTSKVEFVAQVRNMYEQGARVFVELGPGRILSNLVRQILPEEEITALPVDSAGAGLKDTLAWVAELITAGVPVDPLALFDQRQVTRLSLAALVQETRPPEPPDSAWILNGCNTRPKDIAQRTWGKMPPLNLETAQALPAPAGNLPPAGPQQEEPLPAASRDILQAYTQYQQTMRSFLALQEKVVQGFLGGNTADLPDPGDLGLSRPATPPAARQAPPGPARETAGPDQTPAEDQAGSASAPGTDLDLQPASLISRLQGMISERTGYPVDMLGPAMDLESELGIDSIKRMEILETLLDSLPPEQATLLREGMEDLARARTLDSLAQFIASGSASGSPQVQAEQKQTTPDPDLGPVSDKASFLSTVQSMISERTGYPVDMLGPAMDMESELGIDSIKRLEILETFTNTLPRAKARLFQDNMEEISRARTLNALTEAAGAILGFARAERKEREVGPRASRDADQETAPGQAARNVDQTRVPDGPELDTQNGDMGICPRYLMQARPADLPGYTFPPGPGLYLLTEDSWSVAPLLARSLKEKGAQPVVLPRETLTSLEQMQVRVLQARREHGPVQGILHLAPLSGQEMPPGLEGWKEQTAIQVKSLFHLLQLCADDLQAEGSRMGRVVAVSGLGGTFGRASSERMSSLPCAGGCQGLLKTLYLEWPRVSPKALDLDLKLSPADLAGIIIQETSLPAGEVEVGYPGGERTVFSVVPAPLPNPQPEEAGSQPASSVSRPFPTPDRSDWVVLVTGGARGVTSLVTRSFLQSGMRLIVVGRSARDPEQLARVSGLKTAAELRQHFLQENTTRRLGKTPAQIETEINAVLRSREIQTNLESFSQQGAQVEYHALDVRDEQEFGGLIQDISSRYGRLDAVIHGAGIIQDKLIEEKDAQSFDRVFDVKTDSTFVLCKYLRPELLQLIVFFSSTAGRFGNRGQADYGAANEAMNRFACWMKSHWPHVQSVAINWGPWNNPGMATQELNKRFLNMGIVPIAPEAGARFFLEEIQLGEAGPCEVIAGEGPWNTGVQEVFDPFVEFNFLAV